MSRIAFSLAAGVTALSVALLPVQVNAAPSPIVASPIGVSGLLPMTPASQASAVRKAKSYLEMSGFSRTGLIEQLEYEDFSTADATYAVDSLDVNWNTQAARKAKSYLEMSGFSRGGLIEQLEYEGFTSSQAAYGATAAGL
ncbi:Ltp family lipoprotein [Tsukamurella tyrosinosolvens]|uniref:Ltp family lipoprotein n=1 Tax=Tsukamurella tyrosinosolvens TaxID=57704 RepID=UPI00369F05CC